ncbi:Metallo-dependent phosphatase-like protein [Peziza echinospora]|nr:Metallo-dependent phosphatase-like protein [Peziza echinospora]
MSSSSASGSAQPPPPPAIKRKKKPSTLTSITKAALEYAYSLSPSFPKTRFQLVSDLHLEMPPPPQGYTTYFLPPKAPLLVLAGDIGSLAHGPLYRHFLRAQSHNFDHIYLVLGNHELYNLPGGRSEGISRALEWQNTDEHLKGHLTVLNRTRVDLWEKGVTLLGCTLHSLVTPLERAKVERHLNDFRGKIGGGWGVELHNGEFGGDVEWLRGELEGIHRSRVVVVTHHAPTFARTSKPEDEGSGVGSAFATELFEGYWGGGFASWKGAEKVSVWMFGHTHFCTDYTWKGTTPPTPTSEGGSNVRVRLVANQRGYWFTREGEKYDPGFVVEV